VIPVVKNIDKIFVQKRNEWIMTHRQSGGTLPSECH